MTRAHVAGVGVLALAGVAYAEDWKAKEFASRAVSLDAGGYVAIDRPARGPLSVMFADRYGLSAACRLGGLWGRDMRDWAAGTARDYVEFIRAEVGTRPNARWGKALSFVLGDSMSACQIDAAARGGQVYLSITATYECYGVHCVRITRTLEASDRDLEQLAALFAWAAWEDVPEEPAQPNRAPGTNGLDVNEARRVDFPK